MYGGEKFLFLTDVLSGWPTTHNLRRRADAAAVVGAIRDTFRDTAVPTILYSDGRTQFTD